MKKVIRLTESDLVNIINKVIAESTGVPTKPGKPSPFNPKGEYNEGKINKKPGKPSPFNPKESYEEMDERAAVAPSWCQPPCQYVQNLDTWRYICVNDKGYPCSTKTK
jgi:hypothetical protein